MSLGTFEVGNTVSCEEKKFVIERATLAFCDEKELFEQILAYSEVKIFLVFHIGRSFRAAYAYIISE